MKKNNYNSYLLCASSVVYLFAAAMIFEKNSGLSFLLVIVTIFSILYHKNFRNLGLKALDWLFGLTLCVYAYYLFGIEFDLYIFGILSILLIFRLVDHTLFKTKRYGIFSYTHSAWHLITAVVIVFLALSTRT